MKKALVTFVITVSFIGPFAAQADEITLPEIFAAEQDFVSESAAKIKGAMKSTMMESALVPARVQILEARVKAVEEMYDKVIQSLKNGATESAQRWVRRLNSLVNRDRVFDDLVSIIESGETRKIKANEYIERIVNIRVDDIAKFMEDPQSFAGKSEIPELDLAAVLSPENRSFREDVIRAFQVQLSVVLVSATKSEALALLTSIVVGSNYILPSQFIFDSEMAEVMASENEMNSISKGVRFEAFKALLEIEDPEADKFALLLYLSGNTMGPDMRSFSWSISDWVAEYPRNLEPAMFETMELMKDLMITVPKTRPFYENAVENHEDSVAKAREYIFAMISPDEDPAVLGLGAGIDEFDFGALTSSESQKPEVLQLLQHQRADNPLVNQIRAKRCEWSMQ